MVTNCEQHSIHLGRKFSLPRHPRGLLNASRPILRAAILIALGTQNIWAVEPKAAPAHAVGAAEQAQWPTYNNGYKGQRFSPLSEITANNVGELKEVCRVKLADSGSFQSGLVVTDGALYVTTVPDTFSIDPTNCKVHWKFTYVLEQVQVWPSNRGVAVMNGRVFRGTVDGRLLALDAKTGQLIWKNVVGDSTLNEFVSGAPLAWNGLVITGTTGADWGAKGRVLAYDALSGREVWHFNTIPTGNEVGADSWKVRSTTDTGGGGTWSSFGLDVTEGEVFVPVANPAPTFATTYRPGENLFTDSAVVLDARTGALKWWYQLAPNDGRDLDVAAAPMLFTDKGGKDFMAVAGKDGYLHVVDRSTHQLLFKTATTTILNEGLEPTEKETKFCPGVGGGTAWNGPAFESSSGTIFVGAVDNCTMIKTTGETHFGKSQGKYVIGGAISPESGGPPPSGWVTAIDSESGKVKWKYHADAPILAGITATAGGIVLTGDMAGNFLVLDSATGKVLSKRPAGGPMAGGVITYSVAGRQYIALASGNVSRTSSGSAAGAPSVVIMAVDAKAPESRSAAHGSGASPADASRSAGAPNSERGKALYLQNCVACHGATGDGGVGKSLHGLRGRMTFEQSVQSIKNPKSAMPKLFPSPLGEQDVRDIAAFIRLF
jgi:PQQ-dependent dehydrogenase (methanol/ethanol family)